MCWRTMPNFKAMKINIVQIHYYIWWNNNFLCKRKDSTHMSTKQYQNLNKHAKPNLRSLKTIRIPSQGKEMNQLHVQMTKRWIEYSEEQKWNLRNSFKKMACYNLKEWDSTTYLQWWALGGLYVSQREHTVHLFSS